MGAKRVEAVRMSGTNSGDEVSPRVSDRRLGERCEIPRSDSDVVDRLIEEGQRAKILAAMTCDDIEEKLGGAVQLFTVLIVHHRDHRLLSRLTRVTGISDRSST